MYEFKEIDLFVGVGVDSEKVPENVVEFTLGGFLQHFHHESFELALNKESLFAFVVFVEVDFEFVPNGVDETVLLCGNFAWCLHLEATAVQIDSISEVLLDEVDVLLEGNEPIVVSVQFVENILQVLLAWSDLDERCKLGK
jgi:hypothetical protein